MFLAPAMMVIFWLYLFCHFGDAVTQRFDQLGDEMYQVSWYLLSLHLQNDWPMMIALGQKKVYVQGYGSAFCTRELFMKVRIKNIYS